MFQEQWILLSVNWRIKIKIDFLVPFFVLSILPSSCPSLTFGCEINCIKCISLSVWWAQLLAHQPQLNRLPLHHRIEQLDIDRLTFQVVTSINTTIIIIIKKWVNAKIINSVYRSEFSLFQFLIYLFISCSLQHTPLYFVIMRLNLKVVLVVLCLAVFLFTLSIWSHCGDLTLARGFLPKWDRRFNGNNQIFFLFNQMI